MEIKVVITHKNTFFKLIFEKYIFKFISRDIIYNLLKKKSAVLLFIKKLKIIVTEISRKCNKNTTTNIALQKLWKSLNLSKTIYKSILVNPNLTISYLLSLLTLFGTQITLLL